MRIAYLVSRYPLVSHVFILREVTAGRRAGADIHTFTVRRAGPDSLLSSADREADATTFALIPPSFASLVLSHLSALVAHPARYFSTFVRALSLRGHGARATLWQIFYFGEAALMWRECRRRGIRHIHAHHANVASDVALLAAHLGGEGWSWSFTMHGSTEFFDVREHRLPQKVESALFVRCVSDHGRSQLMTHSDPRHWPKLRVVHCGLDLDEFRPVDRRGDSRALEVLTVGRLVPVKGQELLVEAIAALRDDGIAAKLTLVGDGPQRHALAELAARLAVADSVEFAGAVGQDAIMAFYERADVFALPSFAEGLPVVLIEAMATGLPVVASRITGVPELVEEGVSGVLTVPGRADELANAVRRLLTAEPEQRAAMGRAGRQRVEAEFDVAATTRELLSVFEEFVPSGG